MLAADSRLVAQLVGYVTYLHCSRRSCMPVHLFAQVCSSRWMRCKRQTRCLKPSCWANLGPLLILRLSSSSTLYTGIYQTLDAGLAADPRLVAQLLGYVRYSFNPGLQAAALRVAGHLSARLPDLIPLLAGAGKCGSPISTFREKLRRSNRGLEAAALRVVRHLSAQLPDLIPPLAGAGTCGCTIYEVLSLKTRGCILRQDEQWPGWLDMLILVAAKLKWLNHLAGNCRCA